MNITLAPGLLEAIVDHAKDCYPKEGCGLLSGRENTAERFVSMTNIRASETEFEMDPHELIRELRSFRESGQQLVAIYHSHPFAGPYPSKVDIAHAYYPDAASVIVSLADSEKPAVRAFRILEGEALEIELHAIV